MSVRECWGESISLHLVEVEFDDLKQVNSALSEAYRQVADLIRDNKDQMVSATSGPHYDFDEGCVSISVYLTY